MSKLRNKSGRVVTIFIVIGAILLFSLTAITAFLLKKEHEHRKFMEKKYKTSRDALVKVEKKLESLKKKSLILEDQAYEADERINGLLDELELQEGLRDEIKLENADLKQKFEASEAKLVELQAKVGEADETLQAKVAELEKQLADESAVKESLQKQMTDLEAQKKSVMEEMKALETKAAEEVEQMKKAMEAKSKEVVEPAQSDKDVKDVKEDKISAAEKEIELEKIVVVPDEVPEGRILSVDKETDFVIINLGKKDGIEAGSLMSVSRGDEYLGDVKVTRVQTEMSAADLIPPFSSRIVRKNDQVFWKE